MSTDDQPLVAEWKKGLLTVRGSTVIALNDPRRGWFIESGSIAVFRSRCENGHPHGPRRFLFTCRRGEALVGAVDSPTQGRDQCFLAVGLEDALLREFLLDDLGLPATPAGQTAGEEQGTVVLSPENPFLKGIEAWIDRLTELLIVNATIIHTPRPRNFGEQRLELNQAVGTARSVVNWVRIEAGAIRWCGRDALPLTPRADFVPLGRDGWFVAAEATTVILRTTVELENPAQLGRGLAQLHRLCFTHVQTCELREQQAEVARLRRQSELQMSDTTDALRAVGSVLHGETNEVRAETNLLTALAIIGQKLGISFKPPGMSEDPRQVADPLEAICRASRIPYRRVKLRHNWYQVDAGCLLAYRLVDRSPVALLPVGDGRYELSDPCTPSRRRVDAATADELLTDAVMFYRPFSDQMDNLSALYRFALTPLKKEIGFLLVLIAAAATLGMLVPQATQILIDEAIPDANKSLIIQMMLGLLAVATGQGAFVLLEGVMMTRLQTSSTSSLQMAMWDRLLRLPMSFFKSFSSGDLMNRCMIVSEISKEISGTVLRTMFSGGMSLLNFALLFSYNAQLATIALFIVVVLAVVTITLTRRVRQFALQLEKASSRLFGFVVQLIFGIAKLRVSGSELRAYNQWARQYATQLRLTADMQQLQNWGLVFNFALPVVSSMILFHFATDIAALSARKADAAADFGLSMGTFLAFMSSFGTLLAGVTDLSKSIVAIMDTLGKARLIRPILETKVEVTDEHNDPGRISGDVVVDDVSFRYREDGPLVLNHVTLRVEPGEFVAIVGQSGSGKSTLFRLMLGFETAESGRIMYDNQDLTSLDVTAVRRQIGVVLQSAKINSSSIFEYITGGSQMTLDEAWDCAEGAGLADDILAMPMGIHTVINEGGSSFSGGQRQRLMIARALATHAKVLLFDEATSALDNRIQQTVSESIRRKKVTRITIAHRLSTIRHADRICVLECGKVAQLGTFDELTSTPGPFLRMMERQIV